VTIYRCFAIGLVANRPSPADERPMRKTFAGMVFAMLQIRAPSTAYFRRVLIFSIPALAQASSSVATREWIMNVLPYSMPPF